MIRFILRRLMGLVPVMLIILAVAFTLMRVAPGGPFDQDKAVDPQVKAQLMARYQLDKPLPVQFLAVLGSYLRGDLGPSYRYPGRSVNEFIAAGFPVSVQLGLVALVFSLLVGLAAGIAGAVWQNRWPDHTAMAMALIGISVPNFILGPLLILIFSVTFALLPAARWDSWQHMLLPGVTLGLVYAAYIARLTRGGLLEVIRQDFVRTARAKGLSERLVLFRHTLRGGVLPVVTFLGPAMAGLFTGSLVVERIFNIPGMGPYFVDAALNRDYTLALGVVLVDAGFLLIANLVVDVVYGLLDPRVKVG
ncbi:MAG: ABC transporter permease [Myxococcaceae bacterium]|nr:ABC transporter permease [Myxococcaceae bacterium]